MITKKQYLTRLAIACGLTFIILLWLGRPAKGAQKRGEDPYRVETFSIQTPGQLKVKTSGGYIEVKRSKDQSVRVEMFVRKGGETLSPADTDLDNFDVSIENKGNKVMAVAKQNGKNDDDSAWWKFWEEDSNISVSFVIYTPPKMDVRLHTAGGHIEAAGLTGHQKMETGGGHLELSDLSGQVEARTAGGHIELQNINGDVKAKTSGGHIEVDHAKGTLRLKTGGGHIELTDISGSVAASTGGGHISADISQMRDFVRLKTGAGSIDVRVPKKQGLDLDLRGSKVDINLDHFSGKMNEDRVAGTIGGGGPELKAQTGAGTVSVTFR